MSVERFPHLFVEHPPETSGFTSVQAGGSGGEPPIRDRQSHAAYLDGQFVRAWNTAVGRQAALHSTRRGCYIEFVCSPGSDSALKSLESRRVGIRLLNVRTSGESERPHTLATVFVPGSKRAHFLRKINAYASENSQKGRPKNQKLVASVDDIAAALLQDFWTDNSVPIPGETPAWVEAWLAAEVRDLPEFRSLLAAQDIKEHPDLPVLVFPERLVLLILATGPQLTNLIEMSDHLAELRSAREVPTFFLDLENRDQVGWCQNLLDRTTIDSTNNVTVCILDTGINQGHPLIEPILSTEDLHSYTPDWGTADHDGHGTLMAGLAGYGDLQAMATCRQPWNRKVPYTFYTTWNHRKFFRPLPSSIPNTFGAMSRPKA